MPLILIADDAAPFRRLLAARLTVHGFEVLEASDGAKALQAIRDYPIDLLILDLQMPGVDGAGVLSALQAHPSWRDLPVVVTTALHERDAAIYYRHPSVRDVLIKSNFALKELIGRVRELLTPAGGTAEVA